MHPFVKAAGGAAGVGGAALAYSAGYELRAFRLRKIEIPCLPEGASPLKVLHLSDIHLTPKQTKKSRWVQKLADLEPDLVINTGDNLAHRDSVHPLLESFGDLRGLPGVFVFGSNDYWGPVLKSPLRYLLPVESKKRFHGPPLPWRELRQAFLDLGWLDLNNSLGALTVNGSSITFAGVDDPHLEYDDLGAVAGPADASADVRLGITHAPYLRVLDALTTDGYDAIFAGHTHGGQLRLPGIGALVTNCDLDRRRSRGLSTHQVGGREAWLHVSAGLGTSPYAPYRFCCHPEATLVTLTPRQTTSPARPTM
ncbi:MAG: metallophosphoesterase [Nocardioidaceae bacterium]|nr:metallophosphoesterase [Nocardioidaceae bacterium]